jgi:hypothetical protein
VGVAVLVSSSGDDKVTSTSNTSPTPEPTATSTTAPVVDHAPFPAQGIFPFTTATAEEGWQQDYEQGSATQWEADPTQVAQHWVQDFLEQPAVDRVVSQSEDNGDELVTLGRIMQAESHAMVSVTTVRLTPYDKSWIVIGASDPQSLVSFSSPSPGATVTTPLTVTGPAFGVDEVVRLDVRDATSTTSYGTDTASFGNGSGQWAGRIDFSRPPAPIGVLVAVDISAADGGPTRIAAEQVRFAPAAPHQAPQYFYAVKSNRITQFASRTGDPTKYLTSEQPGGGVSDPQLYEDEIYYLQGAGTCANSVMAVSTSANGGAKGEVVASSDQGYVIAWYAAAPKPSALSGNPVTPVAVYETACDPANNPQAKLVLRDAAGATRSIAYPSVPPGLATDPSFDPWTGAPPQFLDGYVRTGNEGYIARYDVADTTTPTPTRSACSGLGPEDGQPAALEVDAGGTLWVALRTGSSMDVMRCAAGSRPKLAFTIAGNDQPADIDVTSDGSAVLLADDNGKVWRWDGSGNPEELSNSTPLDHVTW